MGDFRIVVEACGGHGCCREVKNGGMVEGCKQPYCPDCVTREYVAKLKSMGCSVSKAELTHWPHDLGKPTIETTPSKEINYPKASEVRDDLLTKVRTGNF